MCSNKIVLTSSDGESFEIDEAVARKFKIIANMIEDECADKAIPLRNVSGKILALVIEYCKKHVDDHDDSDDDFEPISEKVAEEANKELETNWDAEFIKDFDMETIFELILAANYLNIKGLLELTTQIVADYIKDMKVEEVREFFTIENDFTPEEEAEVRKESEWAFEGI